MIHKYREITTVLTKSSHPALQMALGCTHASMILKNVTNYQIYLNSVYDWDHISNMF